MAHPAYLRDKAREMRVERGLTLDEVAERLAISRTTVYYWLRDLPALGVTPRRSAARARASRANSERHRVLRAAAYERGVSEFDEHEREPTFRDFVTLFIAEGSKRNRNGVEIANSDAAVIRVALWWLEQLSGRKIAFSVQHHLDQRPGDLQRYWAEALDIDPDEVKCVLKSNSGQLRSRTWRCVHGVMTVRTSDTYLRARMQAWTDRLRAEWVDRLSAPPA